MTSTQRRSPTIDDLRIKMCWICREEESREEGPPHPARFWVHPCSCTLIAHQDCLLEWIKESQLQPSRRENALKCPQCGTRYIIDSQNPVILRLIDCIDRLASRGGKYVTLGIVAGLGVSFAGSIYGLCTLYGAHAVRLYVGDQLYSVIIGDDPRSWDWKVYLNLPLIPFYLLISRMRVFDNVFSTVTFPLLLSFTFPAPSTLAAAHQPFGLPRFLMAYPPTPWICVLVYPLLRTWYLDMKDRLTHWVLKTQPEVQGRPGPLVRRRTWVLEDNDNGQVAGADLRIALDLQGPQQPQRQQQAAGDQGNAQNHNNNGDADANQNADPGHRRVRLTFSSLGRFIGTALATPWIAKYMGALLELASRRSLLLRRILVLEKSRSPEYDWMESVARESGALEKLREVGIKTPWQTWGDHMKPVWWRNSLGLGLWIVAKDAVTLMHLFLRKREMQSRRILSRSFAGIDAGTLDLISPAAF